ncbi:N-fatty-acyl-amino acid synthase/hydrolase PM20D1-like isoform X3 [Scyliorhinus torazame]|uniref:N-fatty-acyl-amino acid synthase/hydrolase PM20D1-like isoform X3 n=1 Tax=Scyliorhinus torazame TaxID=75743 RepID=UPI003B5A1CFC
MKNIKGKVKVAAIIVLLLVSVFLIFLSALLIRTYTFSPAGSQAPGSRRSVGTAPAANFTLQERHQLLANLKGALRIATVSRSPDDLSPAALAQFGDYLPTVFPTVFSSDLVQHEVIANYSHLFTVHGSNDSLQPYMLIAHLDVVPASAEEWEVPPFSAEEWNGYLYGRGTLDDKSSVMVGGNSGARNIARVLQSRGTKLSFLLDEGSAIFNGIIPGLDQPAALIATSEKGYVTIGLSVSTGTGHSSMPPKETSIGILAAAVSKLENNPMPRMFGQGPESGLFEHLSSQLRFPLNVVMANLWLFSSLVGRMMEKEPSTNAIVRTTTAVTEFHAGVKENVIAPFARATVNFRLHPAHTPEELLRQVKNIISDERVKIDVLKNSPSLPLSSYDDNSFGYQVIKVTIGNIFPEVAIAPGLCIASTDTKHYQNLTNELYRFSPVILKKEDLSRIHGVNERISVKNYEEFVKFYFRLMQHSDLWSPAFSHCASRDL